ncbi:MAG: hypothetical protein IIW40_01690 [Clostridia bacterium]|nr:hypothetical protein [Clostridia bacterium]
MSKQHEFRRGFWQNANIFIANAITHNFVLIQALGLTPILAAGVTLKQGVALTVCAAVVQLPLAFIMGLVGNRLAKWLRPALYVLLASLLMVGAAYILEVFISPELYAKLYLFIPLMAVNMLHSRNSGMASVIRPLATIADGLGSTVGFGLVICLISALREMAIYDTLWDIPLGYTVAFPEAAAPFAAFILLGFLAAFLQWIRQRVSAYFRKREEENA